MKNTAIAVIGWGSLIWDPRGLEIDDGGWHPDGPLLPVDYLRVSGTAHPPKRLTLVMADPSAFEFVRNVRTLWAVSAFDNIDDAVRNLARREGTGINHIGRVVSRKFDQHGVRVLNAVSDSAAAPLLEEIENWLDAQNLDAAIWTDLGASRELDLGAQAVDNAIAFLKSLNDDGPDSDKRAAESYVRRTPLQIRTAIRERIETDDQLGWTPQFVPSPLRSGDDLRFKEWSEARTTIGRFDSILVDLRKLGFSIITGLLAASTFLGFLVPTVPAPATGVATVGSAGPSAQTWPLEARGAVWVVLIGLVALLFTVDTYFEVLLSGAVERALDIEVQTDPPVRLTKYLGVNIHRAWGAKLVFGMYLGLMLLVVALAAVMLLLTKAEEISRAPWVAPVLVGLSVLAVFYVAAYWLIAGYSRTRLSRVKYRFWPEGDQKIGAPDVTTWRKRPAPDAEGS